MTVLYIILIFVLFLVVLAAILANRNGGRMYEDEITTTTTTTTTTDSGPTIVGTLVRSFDNGQPFVMDPVDKDKVWLNTKDDMYEDGAGRIWQLA